MTFVSAKDHQRCLRQIIDVYDSLLVRAYCRARFLIININILDILALCLRGRTRVLDVGCGFGLFGCYFASLYPEICYTGYDLSVSRILAAQKAADRLGLKNVNFHHRDARNLQVEGEYDAMLMVDLLHHVQDAAKEELLTNCYRHLAAAGRLVIKDVTTHPIHKIGFTWALDVLMTRGFEMWYWDERRFATMLGPLFGRVETFPISDWLPYPHVVYLCEKSKSQSQPGAFRSNSKE